MIAYTFYTAETARDFSEALGIPVHPDNTVVCTSKEYATVRLKARRIVKGKEKWVPIDPSPFVKSTRKLRGESANDEIRNAA